MNKGIFAGIRAVPAELGGCVAPSIKITNTRVLTPSPWGAPPDVLPFWQEGCKPYASTSQMLASDCILQTFPKPTEWLLILHQLMGTSHQATSVLKGVQSTTYVGNERRVEKQGRLSWRRTCGSSSRNAGSYHPEKHSECIRIVNEMRQRLLMFGHYQTLAFIYFPPNLNEILQLLLMCHPLACRH